MSKETKREKLLAYICQKDRVQFNGKIRRFEEEVYGKPSVLGEHDHFRLKSEIEEEAAIALEAKSALRGEGKDNEELIGEVTRLSSTVVTKNGELKSAKDEIAELKAKLAAAEAAPTTAAPVVKKAAAKPAAVKTKAPTAAEKKAATAAALADKEQKEADVANKAAADAAAVVAAAAASEGDDDDFMDDDETEA